MRWILGISSLVFVALGVNPAQKFEARYKRVESYEIRPDILATPSYAENGLLCKISVEKRHVQAGVVDMSAMIPRKVSMEIIDELAPPSERGPRNPRSGPFDYEVGNGSAEVMTIEYENASVQIYSERSSYGDTAVILTWDKACGSTSQPKRNE